MVWTDSAVEPLRVVHDPQHGLIVGQLGEKLEHRQADQEAIRRRTRAQPKRGLQRGVLRLRQERCAVDERSPELLQARVGELHLRLDASNARHVKALCSSGHGVEKDGLSDSRLPADDQHAAAAVAGGSQQLPQRIELGRPPDKSGRGRVL